MEGNGEDRGNEEDRGNGLDIHSSKNFVRLDLVQQDASTEVIENKGTLDSSVLHHYPSNLGTFVEDEDETKQHGKEMDIVPSEEDRRLDHDLQSKNSRSESTQKNLTSLDQEDLYTQMWKGKIHL